MCIKSYFHLKGRGKINHGEKETQNKLKGLSLSRQSTEQPGVPRTSDNETQDPGRGACTLAHTPPRNRTFQQRFITLRSEIVPYAHLCPSLDYLGLTVVPAKGSFLQEASLHCPV